MNRQKGEKRRGETWGEFEPNHALTRGEDAGSVSADTDRMTLAELTDAADVSVRTVRYYITEGLLPPPEGAGPGSAYGSGHLHRLRLIQRLKAAYLPLKEIRRRLSGLDDEEVRDVLADEDQSSIIAKPDLRYDASLGDAREYLALLESRERYRTEPMALPFSPGPARAMPSPTLAETDAGPQPARTRGPRAAGVVAATRPAERAQTDPVSSQARGEGLWHRIPLGDEAELVISERVYDRHRDRVDWLVRWARKVFG